MKNEAAVLVGRPLMGGGLIVIISAVYLQKQQRAIITDHSLPQKTNKLQIW